MGQRITQDAKEALPLQQLLPWAAGRSRGSVSTRHQTSTPAAALYCCGVTNTALYLPSASSSAAMAAAFSTTSSMGPTM